MKIKKEKIKLCDHCNNPLVFELSNDADQYAVNIETILKCLELAEQQGAIPKINSDWWTKISRRYNNININTDSSHISNMNNIFSIQEAYVEMFKTSAMVINAIASDICDKQTKVHKYDTNTYLTDKDANIVLEQSYNVINSDNNELINIETHFKNLKKIEKMLKIP